MEVQLVLPDGDNIGLVTSEVEDWEEVVPELRNMEDSVEFQKLSRFAIHSWFEKHTTNSS